MFKEGRRVRITALVPEDVYDILNQERGRISMSSFAANILGSYTDVVSEEKNLEEIVTEEMMSVI